MKFAWKLFRKFLGQAQRPSILSAAIRVDEQQENNKNAKGGQQDDGCGEEPSSKSINLHVWVALQQNQQQPIPITINQTTIVKQRQIGPNARNVC